MAAIVVALVAECLAGAAGYTGEMSTKPKSPQAGDPSDLRRLDVSAFALSQASATGSLPLAAFERLRESAAPEAPVVASDLLTWTARGEARQRPGETQLWIHLEGRACIALSCQRCLQPVRTDVVMSRSFRFVESEAAAAALDAESEEDILAIEPDFDLLNLLEDEMLLALPLVPRHEVCPQPLPQPLNPELESKQNPFAALAQLRGVGKNSE
jgi:uncharacterized protein